MYLRSTVLGVVIAIAGTPICAEELTFDLTGSAVMFNAPNTSQPFDISFTLDTLGGNPFYLFGGSQCLQEFGAGSVSNFTASIGGHRVASALSGGFGGNSITSGCEPDLLQFSFAAGNPSPQTEFQWELGAAPGPSKTEFATWSDPLGSMLASLTFGGFATLTSPAGQWDLRLKSSTVAVPEPGALELMALGFLGVAGASFARRRRLRPVQL